MRTNGARYSGLAIRAHGACYFGLAGYCTVEELTKDKTEK